MDAEQREHRRVMADQLSFVLTIGYTVFHHLWRHWSDGKRVEYLTPKEVKWLDAKLKALNEILKELSDFNAQRLYRHKRTR